MATASNIPAWRISWTKKPGRLQFMGCKDLDTTEQLTHSLTHTHTHTHDRATHSLTHSHTHTHTTEQLTHSLTHTRAGIFFFLSSLDTFFFFFLLHYPGRNLWDCVETGVEKVRVDTFILFLIFVEKHSCFIIKYDVSCVD